MCLTVLCYLAYSLFLVDPSGNRDMTYCTCTNAYTWLYVEPIPWGKVIGSIFGITVLIAIAILEIRRRERKAALERYAQRKMRRKFKLRAIQETGDDHWKEVFDNVNETASTGGASSSASAGQQDSSGPAMHECEQSKDRKKARRRQRRRRRDLLQNERDSSDDDGDNDEMRTSVQRRPPKPKTR